MPFTAVVHFSGAGIAHVVRDPKGRIQEAYNLFPEARHGHGSGHHDARHVPHTPRLCLAAKTLVPGLLKDLEAKGIDHRVIPGTDGSAPVMIELFGSASMGEAGPQRMTIRSDRGQGLSERKYTKSPLTNLWDASAALKKVKGRDVPGAYSLVVDIKDGKLGSEDRVPGEWKVDGVTIPSPFDRMRVTIQCDSQLVLEMELLKIGLAPPEGESVVELSFTHLPDRYVADEEIHYHVLEAAMEDITHKPKWPYLSGGVTFPLRVCPYVLFQS
jgi:hypothetical protein